MAKLMVLRLFSVCYIRYTVVTGIVITGVDCICKQINKCISTKCTLFCLKKKKKS